MCHDHAFSLTTDQLSWQLSLDLGLSLALGLSTELNCVIWVQPLSQIPSTDLHCKFFDPEGGLKHKFRQQVCCIHAGCLDAALVAKVSVCAIIPASSMSGSMQLQGTCCGCRRCQRGCWSCPLHAMQPRGSSAMHCNC